MSFGNAAKGLTCGPPLMLWCPMGLLPGEECFGVLGKGPLYAGWRGWGILVGVPGIWGMCGI